MEHLETDPVSWSEGDKQGLNALLDVLIPATVDGVKPSGSGVGFLHYTERLGISGEILVGVQRFLQEFGVKDGIPFTEVAATERPALVKVMERKQGAFFRMFIKHVMHCYYQDSRVLAAIGVEPRPPFPDGYSVSDGDLLLLEPVFERGRIYR